VSHIPIEKKIKYAKIAAIISGVVTFTGSMALIIRGKSEGVSLINVLSLFDALFIFCMAYGIYKKNRICAVLMFEYFFLSIIFRISITSQLNIGSFIIGWTFLYFFYQGITGTYAHHKCRVCDGEAKVSDPLRWILAGSAGLIVYFLVLPGLILQS